MMPLFFVLFYMSMDLTPLVFGRIDFTLDERKLVAMIFGLVMLFASYLIDRRTVRDFAFWGYLFGMITFWGGLIMMDSDSELSKFFYLLINLGLVFLSIIFNRVIFVICGAIGCFIYLGHLATKVFQDTLSFSIAASMLGLVLILLAIYYQKYKTQIDDSVRRMIPNFLIALSPLNRK